MKVKANVVEVSDEGLEGLLGKEVTVWCCRYIYTGILEGVNADDIKLSDARLVFDTGKFDAKEFADAQALPAGIHYVRTAAIESYCERR